MKVLKVIFCLCLVSFYSYNLYAASLIMDGFESRDMSITNEAGFKWGKNNRTSLVIMHPVEGSTAVYNNKSIYKIQTGNDWAPKNGEVSLRFRYPENEAMAEQRFSLGKSYTDIWFRYWIKVPKNFEHGSKNNKFLSLWVGEDGYDTYGTVTWQTRPDGSGGANIGYQDGGVLSGETDRTEFISVPSDRDRWMQVVARVKSASGEGKNDGIIQLYRRWDGESQWTKIHEKLNADTWRRANVAQGISHGYLMGWANDPYNSETEWLLDDFEVSTESLLDIKGAGEVPGIPPNLNIIK